MRKLSDFLINNYAACTLKQHTGIDCPGCGMQRSLASLLQGNVSASVQYFPALIPLFFLFAFLVLHVIFKFQNGAKTLLLLFITSSLIIVIHFLYKLSPLLLP